MSSRSPYGRQHRAARAAAIEKALNTSCPGCGKLMLRGQELDFDHSTPLAVDPTSKGDRIMHSRCNRGDGGRLGSRRARLGPTRIR